MHSIPAKQAPNPDSHYEPERTTPQGTQSYSVVTGHEERDVILPPIFISFAILFAFTIVVFIGMFFAYGQYAKMEDARDAQMPEMLRRQQAPPRPRLLPNIADNPDWKKSMVIGPMEYLEQVRADEEHQLEKLGLWKAEEGVASLPPAAAQVATAGEGGEGAQDRMPSDSSGGLSTENRLR